MKPAKLHIAGTPCTDFSPRGEMKGLAGVTTGFLFCWILHRLIMQDDYVLQENVQSFTTSIICETLGHMYHVEQALLDPRDFGWPIARVRKYTVLLHKTKTGAMTQPFETYLLDCSTDSSQRKTQPKKKSQFQNGTYFSQLDPAS